MVDVKDQGRPDRPGFWRAKEKSKMGIIYYRIVRFSEMNGEIYADSFYPVDSVERCRWFGGWAGMVSELYEHDVVGGPASDDDGTKQGEKKQEK